MLTLGADITAPAASLLLHESRQMPARQAPPSFLQVGMMCGCTSYAWIVLSRADPQPIPDHSTPACLVTGRSLGSLDVSIDQDVSVRYSVSDGGRPFNSYV